jgi:hypothetical protein
MKTYSVVIRFDVPASTKELATATVIDYLTMLTGNVPYEAKHIRTFNVDEFEPPIPLKPIIEERNERLKQKLDITEYKVDEEDKAQEILMEQEKTVCELKGGG